MYCAGRLSILLGFDATTLPDDLYSAYNDPELLRRLEFYRERLDRNSQSQLTTTRVFNLVFATHEGTDEERIAAAAQAQAQLTRDRL